MCLDYSNAVTSSSAEQTLHANGVLQIAVLATNLPVGLASVNCEGNETSLLDCVSLGRPEACGVTDSSATDGAVLACANSVAGAHDHMSQTIQDHAYGDYWQDFTSASASTCCSTT